MQRIQLERVLKGVNRLRILLALRVGSAQKIPGIGILRIDSGDAHKSVNRALRVVGVLVEQAEIEPGIGVFRPPFNSFFQQLPRRINAREIQLCDALVQFRNFQLRIKSGGILKVLEALLEQLLVHVCRPEIVEARGFH